MRLLSPLNLPPSDIWLALAKFQIFHVHVLTVGKYSTTTVFSTVLKCEAVCFKVSASTLFIPTGPQSIHVISQMPFHPIHPTDNGIHQTVTDDYVTQTGSKIEQKTYQDFRSCTRPSPVYRTATSNSRTEAEPWHSSASQPSPTKLDTIHN